MAVGLRGSVKKGEGNKKYKLVVRENSANGCADDV